MRRMLAVSAVLLVGIFSFWAGVSGQQPQCPTCPSFAANAKYLNGSQLGGFGITAGSGLTLNVGAGTSYCSNAIQSYAGGTLTMANNATNYVFLDASSACAPASNTSGFTSSTVPLATVVTSGGVITTVAINATAFKANSNNTTAATSVANGTAALGTSAIASGICATVVTVSATGVLTTDNIQADFNADPTGVTGYIAPNMLTIIKYPTANNVNFKVCNNTGSSITPGAITLNWRVAR